MAAKTGYVGARDLHNAIRSVFFFADGCMPWLAAFLTSYQCRFSGIIISAMEWELVCMVTDNSPFVASSSIISSYHL